MNSFEIKAVGHLTDDPELIDCGDNAYTRFCLVGNDYARGVGMAAEVVSTVWFVAFGPLGDSLARGGRKGDQLIVKAALRSNTESLDTGGTDPEHVNVVQDSRFGARATASRVAETDALSGRTRRTSKRPKAKK